MKRKSLERTASRKRNHPDDPQYIKIEWVGEHGAFSIQESASIIQDEDPEPLQIGKLYMAEWQPYGNKSKGKYKGKIVAMAGEFHLDLFIVNYELYLPSHV